MLQETRMSEKGRQNSRAFIPVAHSNGFVDIPSKLTSSLYLLDHMSEEEEDEEDLDSWSTQTTPTIQTPAAHGWSDVTLTGSYASWEDDDEGVLDKMAAEQVGLLFDAVDQSLYEGHETGFQHMDKECVYWRDGFPHMRIKGQHLLDSLEDGTEIVDPILVSNRRGAPPKNPSIPKSDLMVAGESVKLCSPPPVMVGDSSDDHTPGLHYEEILACNGLVEEYFAYNYNTSNSERDAGKIMKRSSYSHHYHKIPPVSPSSCLKDTVSALLFDQLWNEVASVLHPLIKSAACQRTAGLPQDDSRHRSSQGHVPIHELFLPKNSIQPMRGDIQGAQMMKHLPLVLPTPSTTIGAGGAIGSGATFINHSSMDLPSLKNVMTIKPVALQQRIPSSTLPHSFSSNTAAFQHPVDGSDSNAVLHDFSKGLIPNSRHVSFTHTPIPPRISEPKLASGKIGNKRNPLKPLEVPRTPGVPIIEEDLKEFGGLRGQRLVRHAQLPPIDPSQFDMAATKSPQVLRNYPNKGSQPVASFSSQRIVSAVADTRGGGTGPSGDFIGLTSKKNPFLGAPLDLRPNTSQTFHRSETPLTRRGSNNSVVLSSLAAPPSSSSPIKVIGYAANLHGDPILWEEHEEELR